MRHYRKYKIAILGLGGVGGYFGGKLAAHYHGSPDVEIIFIARGETEKIIRGQGLKLITPQGDQVAHPSLVTNNPAESGHLDLVLCCVKGYDLESGIETLRPCVNEETIIISTLNGVDGAERIRVVLPQADTWEGFAYIISLIESPGVVKQTGDFRHLYFGSPTASAEQLKRVEEIFTSAGIEAKAPPDIFAAMWEKFHFISAIATLTSALDLSIGAILENDSHKDQLMRLLRELKAVADAKGIHLPEDAVDLTLDKMKGLPYETTSSMHRDFHRGKKTELESLTGYVVRQGKALGVAVPAFEKFYDVLLRKLEQK